MLFGETKSGKTTLAHYLVQNPLVARQVKEQLAYVLDSSKPSRLAEAVIGVTHESETVIPNSCQIGQFKVEEKVASLLDCPGYSDSKGPFVIIMNAYFHYRVFSKVKNAKFILTFDAKYMTGTYERPLRTLQNFLNSFRDPQAIQAQLVPATVFYFTKTSPEQQKNIKDIIATLRTTAIEKLPKHKEFISALIDSIVE